MLPTIELHIEINSDGNFVVAGHRAPREFAGQGIDLLSAIENWVEMNEDTINQLEYEIMETSNND